MGIRIATGGKPNQSTVCFFAKKYTPLARTQCNACNHRLNLSNYFTADIGMRTGFNRSLCMALCTPRLPNFFKMQTNLLYFCLVSPRIGLNSHSSSACHVSNERKQISAQIYDVLLFSRGYTLRVMMELIYCIVTFLHTVFDMWCVNEEGMCRGCFCHVRHLQAKSEMLVVKRDCTYKAYPNKPSSN